MSDHAPAGQTDEPPRGSIVQPAFGDDLFVVIGRVVRPFQTDLVLREWLPSGPDAEPETTRVDQRYCVLVAQPVRPGGIAR